VYATDWCPAIVEENKQRVSFILNILHLTNCTFSQFYIAEGPFAETLEIVLPSSRMRVW